MDVLGGTSAVSQTDATATGGNGHLSGQGQVTVRIWGVRGSIPVPGPHTLRYGGNTSCISVEAPTDDSLTGDGDASAGGDLFILDAGSGIRELGLWLLRERHASVTAHLLLTHTHWDHIQGFPFFLPAFKPGNRVVVHGSADCGGSLEEALSGQMQHRYFPVSLEELGADLRFRHVEPGWHHVGNASILSANLHHTELTHGYRLDVGGVTIAYVTDTEPLGDGKRLELDPAALELARDVDLLIHDAQYTDAEYPAKVHWGHSPVSYVVDLAIAAGAKRLLLFHHDPLRSDDALDSLVAAAQSRAAGSSVHVDAAAEGMTIVLRQEGAGSVRLPTPGRRSGVPVGVQHVPGEPVEVGQAGRAHLSPER